MAYNARALVIAPVAVTGAVALSLGAAPAVAADTDTRDMQRDAIPAPASKAVPRAASGAAAVPASSVPRIAYTAASAPTTYTVRPGDTLTGIAIRHGLRTIDLLHWNDLGWSSVIFPGDVIALRAPSSDDAAPEGSPASPVPAPETGRKTYTVQAGDTLSGIAMRHRIGTADLIRWNDLDWSSVIYPGDVLALGAPSSDDGSGGGAPQGSPASPDAGPETGEKTYTVQAGDTLWSIAAAHDLSVDALLKLNELDAASIIYPGQKIVVRAAESSPEQPRSIYDSPEYDLQATLNAPQAENARLIIGVGRSLGVPDQGIAIALATAMVESSMRNLDGGDRDSVGLFQQRPSAGWGTARELTDRGIATNRFFLGTPDGATRGLLDLPGWESLSFGDAAQAVQISAFPDRYDRWRVAAWGWLARHG